MKNTLMNSILSAMALALALVLGAGPAVADDKHGHKAGGAGAMVDASMAEGEIRKVNKDAGKLTIKHGEIKSLDMPPMTMVFRVKDPAMLDQVKPGDKVRFAVESAGGAMTITKMETTR